LASRKIPGLPKLSTVIPLMHRFAFTPHCIDAFKSDLFGEDFGDVEMSFTAQIVARLKPDEERYVRRRAEQEERSISSVIRCLVNEAIKSEQQQPHQAA
jgi:hypothetical protein